MDKRAELEDLKDTLRNEEFLLVQYRQNVGRDEALNANYQHKKAHVEQLRAQVAALEKELKGEA